MPRWRRRRLAKVRRKKPVEIHHDWELVSFDDRPFDFEAVDPQGQKVMVHVNLVFKPGNFETIHRCKRCGQESVDKKPVPLSCMEKVSKDVIES